MHVLIAYSAHAHASTGEIIATSANQIVLTKFHGGTNVVLYSPDPPSS